MVVESVIEGVLFEGADGVQGVIIIEVSHTQAHNIGSWLNGGLLFDFDEGFGFHWSII